MKQSIVFLVFIVTACASSKHDRINKNDGRNWVEETFQALTQEQKIGQMIFPRSDGMFKNEDEPSFGAVLEAASEGRIGGVVFFKGDPYETSALANRFQEVSSVPLLMASDFEWGPAMRVRGASRFPKAMVFGAGGDIEDIKFQAEVTAREARALGIQLVLNPVLDLNNNPDNKVINTRSLGDDPERVADFGASYIRQAQDFGVLTAAKHFPGHGATKGDSHQTLPVLKFERERFDQIELIPFKAAIEAGVAVIMTAHIAAPALDGSIARPVTLSSKALRGVLRDELGFRGLIASDALDMAGVRQSSWDGEVAVAAVQAGVDMLLVPPDPLATYQALLRAVNQGRVSTTRVDEAVKRILEAKKSVGLHRNRKVELAALSRTLNAQNVRTRSDEIAERGVTLLRDAFGVLPLNGAKAPKLVLIEILLSETENNIDVLTEELSRRAGGIRHFRVTPDSVANLGDQIQLHPSEIVVVVNFSETNDAVDREETAMLSTSLLLEFTQHGLPVVFASLGNPYVLDVFPKTSALLVTYDDSAMSQRAIARALFGEISVVGKLPVHVSAEYPRGSGIELTSRYTNLEKIKNPEDVGLSSKRLGRVSEIIEEGIAKKATPGAVAIVGRRGKIVFEEAFGHLSYQEDAPLVNLDTIYDLASLTKVIVTTTLSMILYERELLGLDVPVSTYIPEFTSSGKDEVLIRDLLAHCGGLLWWTDLYKQFEGRTPEEAYSGYIETISKMPLDYEPRTKTSYSDLGVLLLGEVIQRITGMSLDGLASEEIFKPLGMTDIFFRPEESLRSRIAPTEKDNWRGRIVHGEVHDENAFGLGGIAPHAGLFSTARALVPIVQMLLNGGFLDGKRLLNGATISLFTRRAGLVAESSRALGWDTPSGSSSAGNYFSNLSFGHTGYTGTSIWIDPERELFAILLTNRVHTTRDNRQIYELRPRFHDAVMGAIIDSDIVPRSR